MRGDIERKLLSLGEETGCRHGLRAGISVQVLSHTTPGIQGVTVREAAEAARSVNDMLAAAIAEQPYTVRPGSLRCRRRTRSPAVSELRRACGELGFVGAAVNGVVTAGRFLDEECFRPLLRELARLGVPLHIHPGSAAAGGGRGILLRSQFRRLVVARRCRLGLARRGGSACPAAGAVGGAGRGCQG